MSRWRLLPLSLLLVILGSESFGQRLHVPLTVTRHRLENGLQVLAHEDHTLPVISYYTFYKVGSRNETVGTTGISHLFEHMMFNGAKNTGRTSSTGSWRRTAGTRTPTRRTT